MTQTYQTRVMSKHDTTEHWNNAVGFVPLPGEIIIYDDYKTVTYEDHGETITKNIPGIKIGNGNAYVQDLAFIDDGLRDRLMAHIDNQEIHVALGEKVFWNNKVNIDDAYEIVHGDLEDETLIFNRD